MNKISTESMIIDEINQRLNCLQYGWDLDTLDQLNGLTLRCYQLPLRFKSYIVEQA